MYESVYALLSLYVSHPFCNTISDLLMQEHHLWEHYLCDCQWHHSVPI